MNELITIIINVYNGEKYIKKCLDSVINQTYKKIEILIINDGSTDKTLDILKTYKDKRIRIITTENQGLSFSRNVGLDNAKGEYYYFVDADDFIEKDTIEYLYNLSKKYNANIATCECLDIFDYNFKIKKEKEKICIFSREEMLKSFLLNQMIHCDTSWNKLIKKDIYNNIRFENKMINDLTTTYKLIMSSKKTVYSNQIKYYYYRNQDSVTIRKKHALNRNIEIYKVLIKRYYDIKEKYPSLVENDISMAKSIIMLYSRNNKKLREYLNDEGAIQLFKKNYSIKMLRYKMSKKLKIKFIIFSISPKLYQLIIDGLYKFLNNNKDTVQINSGAFIPAIICTIKCRLSGIKKTTNLHNKPNK